jgi:hypothetical protein
MFNEPNTEAGLLNKSSCFALNLGVTKIVIISATNWVTLY